MHKGKLFKTIYHARENILLLITYSKFEIKFRNCWNDDTIQGYKSFLFYYSFA